MVDADAWWQTLLRDIDVSWSAAQRDAFLRLWLRLQARCAGFQRPTISRDAAGSMRLVWRYTLPTYAVFVVVIDLAGQLDWTTIQC